MGYTNVLVPYDESEHARNALREAIKVVNNSPDATITIVEVSAPPQDLVLSSINKSGFGMGSSLVPKDEFAKVMESRTEEGDEELRQDIADIVVNFPGTVNVQLTYGIYTVETIIDAAKHNKCELIVMGSRGLGAIRGMIGSVSYGVLRESEVPVLITK